MKNSVLILGATSDLGMAIGEIFAKHEHPLILAARNPSKLIPYATNLKIRYGNETATVAYDATLFDHHKALIENLPESCETVICCVGYLGDQELAFENLEETVLQINTNYLGLITVLNAISKKWKNQNVHGTIIGLTSVAGERGRMSNYIYGSSKAGLTTYLSGLRNSLHHFGIHVMTIKLGFADTKMTAHLDLPKSLTVTPEKAAKYIYKSYLSKRNVAYVLPIWKYIMLVIKLIPESIFKKLKL